MRTLSLYAIVRFMPFAETQEFANVGVVLCAPDQGKLFFKLARKRFGRVTQFFDDLDGKLYTQALTVIEQELKRVEAYVAENPGEKAALIFNELTRHREGVIYFGNARPALVDNPVVKLDEPFERYVQRDFINEEYRERVLEKLIRQTFNEQKIEGFKKAKLALKLGDFELPFVRDGIKGRQIIKPLAFDRKTPLAAFEHAKQWTDRFVKLRDENQIHQQNMLIALDVPEKAQFQDAYLEAIEAMRRHDIPQADIKEQDRLIAFAR